MKELLKRTERAIKEYGVTDFISGMALGVDLDFAETVLKLRKKYAITLECALPCPEQAAKWDKKAKSRYEKILRKADIVTLVSDKYDSQCMLKRNRYMVDKSGLVIAVFNGIESGGTWYTMNYAKKEHKTIEIIDLYVFAVIK